VVKVLLVSAMSSVLISGGGIGGLCTRLALKQLGVSSDLFDLAPAIVKPDSDEPLLLLPNATRILVDMGFSPLVGKAQTVDRWTILNTKGQVLGGANFAQLSAEHAGGTAAVVMRSNDLLSAMLKAGAGTKGVMSPVRVAAGLNNLALQGDGTLLASFTARIPERAVTLVVGADGVPSKVRELRCGPPTADGDVQVPFPGWGFWSWEAPADVASALQLHAGRRVLEVWGKGVRLRASPLADKGAHLTATVQHQRPTPPGMPRGRGTSASHRAWFGRAFVWARTQSTLSGGSRDRSDTRRDGRRAGQAASAARYRPGSGGCSRRRGV
jgi:2-polyprenyl-6-methoxyphenol hydroxylase-like FAD-dependent oxidoreductase